MSCAYSFLKAIMMLIGVAGTQNRIAMNSAAPWIFAHLFFHLSLKTGEHLIKIITAVSSLIPALESREVKGYFHPRSMLPVLNGIKPLTSTLS